MQVAYPDAQGARPQEHPAVAPRRPTTIDLLAGALLVATIVLHVVAMFPHYFGGAGQTSLSSQPDQAAEYAVLAAGWALALGIGLSSPARAGIAAGLAVGVGPPSWASGSRTWARCSVTDRVREPLGCG